MNIPNLAALNPKIAERFTLRFMIENPHEFLRAKPKVNPLMMAERLSMLQDLRC